MDGIISKSSQPLRNQQQGANPPSHMGIWGQVPIIPKLVLLVLQLDPISLSWPPIPTNMPSDIPKFEGKVGDDPGAYVITFHLWCSSNSLNDDSVRLRLFQRTLTSTAAKWYIELPFAAFNSFWDLANVFLSHFQLLVQYDAGTDLLSTFRLDKSNHILDHIQEWRRRNRLIKATISLEFLLE